MPSNTTSISMQRFSADWSSNVPIRLLCERYGISKDQLSRLCRVWKLPPRKNRATYYKPSHPAPPSAAEDEASGRSCDLAPDIRKRVEDLRQGIGGPVIRGTPVHENGRVDIQVFVFDAAEPQSIELYSQDGMEGPKEVDANCEGTLQRGRFLDLRRPHPGKSFRKK